MMKFVFSIILISLLQFSFGQNTIEEAQIQFKLPNKEWKLINNAEQNGIVVYYFKRSEIKDPNGLSIIPNIAFIIEETKEDLITWSTKKRSQVPFDVNSVFIHSEKKSPLKFENAIGYQGEYKDENDLMHSVYVVHLMNNGKGVQIIMDITKDLFEEYQSEFITTLKSLRISK